VAGWVRREGRWSQPVRRPRALNDPHIEIVARGRRPHQATVAYAREKVSAALRAAPKKVRFARVTLTFEEHRSIERPAKAEALLDVDGRVVHAEAVARSSTEAIDLVEQRLRRRLNGIRRKRPRKTKIMEG
jgi:ribosome-associated translation inhibitor RaiA